MSWNNLNAFAKKKYSQTGEEGILERIFSLIGTTNKYAVEFGASDGYNLSNTRLFAENGWDVLMMDGSGNQSSGVMKEFITAENINQLFEKYSVPHEFDLLSIDIDGNDYWVLKALEYKPRVIVAEINGAIDPGVSKTIVYDQNFTHDGTAYYGASLEALRRLCDSKGYVLVCEHKSLNAFFVLKELVPSDAIIDIKYKVCHGHPPDNLNRPWVEV